MKRSTYITVGIMWLALAGVNAAMATDPLSALVIGSCALAAGVNLGIAVALVALPSSRPERT